MKKRKEPLEISARKTDVCDAHIYIENIDAQRWQIFKETPGIQMESDKVTETTSSRIR
ncbi:MAG: hypothetical protein ACLTLE_01265 [Lachnospiraceae bacterium]